MEVAGGVGGWVVAGPGRDLASRSWQPGDGISLECFQPAGCATEQRPGLLDKLKKQGELLAREGRRIGWR